MNIHKQVILIFTTAISVGLGLYGTTLAVQSQEQHNKAEDRRVAQNRKEIFQEKCATPTEEFNRAFEAYLKDSGASAFHPYEALEMEWVKDPNYQTQRQLRSMELAAKESCKEALTEMDQVKPLSYENYWKIKLRGYFND